MIREEMNSLRSMWWTVFEARGPSNCEQTGKRPRHTEVLPGFVATVEKKIVLPLSDYWTNRKNNKRLISSTLLMPVKQKHIYKPIMHLQLSTGLFTKSHVFKFNISGLMCLGSIPKRHITC